MNTTEHGGQEWAEHDDDMLDTAEAAPITGWSRKTLANRRVIGGGPPFVKLGDGRRGTVRYRRSDLRAWLQSRTRTNTAGGVVSVDGDAVA